MAIANQRSDSEIQNYETIPNIQEIIDKFIRKQASKNIELHCVYEAGPPQDLGYADIFVKTELIASW